MPFTPPPKILQKVFGFKAFTPKDGKMLLWGNPMSIIPNYVLLYLVKLIQTKMDKSELNKCIFYMAELQAEAGMKIINERFGYAESIKDKNELLNFNLGQLEVLGLGSFKMEKVDFTKPFFYVKGKSAFAEEHKRFFGIGKENVDYVVMGLLHKASEMITKQKLIITEENCIAKGAIDCDFCIRNLETIDKNDPKFADSLSLLEKVPDMKELGAKINPYVKLY